MHVVSTKLDDSTVALTRPPAISTTDMRFFANCLYLAIGLYCGGQATAVAQPPASGPPPVAVKSVVQTTVAEEQSFLGSLQARRQATIGSAVEGRVETLNVQPGDFVRAKTADTEADVLAQLETEMLEIEIEAARIQHQLAEQAAVELAKALPAEIETAASRMAESRARQEYARQELERFKRLASSQASAVAQVELELATSQWNSLAELARQADIEHQRLVATRETREAQAKLRAAAAAQELARLKDLKTRYTVRAPFDGFVVNKFTDVGAWLTKGAPVVEIVQIDQLDFVFNVPQGIVARVQRAISDGDRDGRQIEVTLEGWPESIQAEVQGIVPLADLRARTLPVRATLINPQIQGRPVLQPGMLGRAIVPVGVQREVLLVPQDALVLQGRGTVVFRVERSGEQTTAHLIQVVPGVSRKGMVEVTGDLNAGDQIIVLGNERLRNGEAVRIQNEAAAEDQRRP